MFAFRWGRAWYVIEAAEHLLELVCAPEATRGQRGMRDGRKLAQRNLPQAARAASTRNDRRCLGQAEHPLDVRWLADLVVVGEDPLTHERSRGFAEVRLPARCEVAAAGTDDQAVQATPEDGTFRAHDLYDCCE